MSVKLFAAIDIGSYELSMKIYEFSGKNNMRQVDSVTHRLDMGSETYVTGRLSTERMEELCHILKGFTEIMAGYKVEAYRACATSAVREVVNSDIILDQIKQKTGLVVEILNNSEQRFLDYKSVAATGESFRKIIEEKTAILDIGGGSIQLSLFDNDTLVSTQNLNLGVLRIQEILQNVNVSRERFGELVDELASAQLNTYKKLYLKDREIKNIIIVDDYLSPVVSKRAGRNKDKAILLPGAFEEQLKAFYKQNTFEAAAALGISEERVPLVLISAMILRRLVLLTGAKQIWVPGVSLADGIAYDYAERIKMFRDEHDFEKDIVACALNISKRYMGSRKRAETLENLTTIIYDSMKKVHGMGKRERLYLRIAATLHDCGKYISMRTIGETSYNIIKSTEIIGLSETEREIVASVVRFNHSNFVYSGHEAANLSLDTAQYLTMAKLTAILRLANSLDRSHNQKFKGMKAVLQENELVLTVDTPEDITLEKHFFAEAVPFFREVFGVTPVLKQKKTF